MMMMILCHPKSYVTSYYMPNFSTDFHDSMQDMTRETHCKKTYEQCLQPPDLCLCI